MNDSPVVPLEAPDRMTSGAQDDPAGVFDVPAPEITVLLPSFNSRRCVVRAVRSVLAQTMDDFELMIVDDASTDGTPTLLAREFATDPRIRFIQLTENRGPAHARNVALRLARGRWIALIDADDAWRPGRLERLLQAGADADAVFDNLAGADAESGEETGPIFPQFPEGALTIERLLATELPDSGYNLGYLKPLIRREFLHRHALGYDESLRTGEDLVFYLSLLIAGARAKLVNSALYIYTTPVGHASRKNSTHSNTTPRDEQVQAALERISAQHGEQLSPQARRAIAKRIEYLRQIGPRAAFYHARRTGRYGVMAKLIARESSVRREVVAKLRRRIAAWRQRAVNPVSPSERT